MGLSEVRSNEKQFLISRASTLPMPEYADKFHHYQEPETSFHPYYLIEVDGIQDLLAIAERYAHEIDDELYITPAVIVEWRPDEPYHHLVVYDNYIE